MRTIDSLLALVASQQADGLQFQVGRPPFLLRGDEVAALSMPPLDPGLFAMIEAEVIPEEQRGSLDGQRDVGPGLSLPYQAENGDRFTVTRRVEGSSAVLRILAARVDTPPTPPPEQGPPSREDARPAEPTQPATPATPDSSFACEPAVDPLAPAPASSPEEAQRPSSPAGDITFDADDPRDLGPLAELLPMIDAGGVTDLLLSTATAPRARRGGELTTLSHLPASADWIPRICERLDARHRAALEREGSCDCPLVVVRGDGQAPIRFRLNLFRQRAGVTAALRPIFDRCPSLADLHLPASLEDLATLRSGLVLLTGTAGCGKSTTMVALVEHVNRHVARHVITLEDPIEYIYTPKRALIHQREIGRDVPDFAVGLRAALRESPDVVLVGEMRDAETIAAALTAAETGHLVISTLHCASAPTAIDRITDAFEAGKQAPVRHQLANVLKAVVTQRLVAGGDDRLYPAVEILRVNTAVAAKIREHKAYSLTSDIQTGRAEGMEPLELSLARLVVLGHLSPAAAKRHTDRPRLVDEHVAALQRG
ncbi:MAG: PilT/PilU family type 4a pilus ATPase [Myxococcales bacterium FL481]|nr:MAG: PilT/PilU family type 4a pilus ATPase [Myxococcales bacterium FL481]